MNGIIVVNKPKGCTSHDIVYKIKKLFNQKVGHTGTLDPMAEGVLPILVGKGTLLSKYLINHDKKYVVKLQLGIKTDTADSEGKVIEEKDVNVDFLNEEDIIKILKSFIGQQEQIPPIYSAIKVNGKKLYEYARKGQNIELKPREIEIYDINLIDYSIEEKQIKFEVFCGKGTYIRSLCEDIAKKFETVGYMKELKRIKVGDFNIEDSVTIEDLQNNVDDEKYIDSKIISIEKLFSKSNIIKLDIRKLELFLNGVKLTQNFDNGIYRIYDKDDKFIGIGVVENNLLKRDIVL
ncbi:MAG: tRNA pseudouridine(55) synthase TruB [Clostridia bacterium]|jgi:tRNA pseudouridine55 synthase|nr:tRNA pseudouridine(55) synthase TruB [Clostridia bacterium]